MISIVIPIRDGGEDLRRCLEAIASQHVVEPVEVVVVDSGSQDGSLALARSHGATVREIPAERFSHGRARNLGAAAARGDLLVFISQDAAPLSQTWLDRLTGPLHADPTLAGTYGRQVAHPDASPSEQFFLDFLYGSHPREQRADSAAELTMSTTLFSNVNSALRHELLDRHPFAEDVVMSEDQDWSRRVLLEGYGLRYLPEAGVLHSHPYTLGQAFRRFFDSGASAERAYLAGARASAEVLRSEAVRYALGELRWLWSTGRRRAIPYAIVYEGGKFVGLQLGARHRRLPLWLKRRFSALPAFWMAAGPGG